MCAHGRREAQPQGRGSVRFSHVSLGAVAALLLMICTILLPVLTLTRAQLLRLRLPQIWCRRVAPLLTRTGAARIICGRTGRGGVLRDAGRGVGFDPLCTRRVNEMNGNQPDR